MQGYHVLGFGSFMAALVALPLAVQAAGQDSRQGSPDEALEQACRAKEAVAPESCACTVTKARAAGVSQQDMASLFQDDGHRQPVGRVAYQAFWKAKTQCITKAVEAELGSTSGNPPPVYPVPPPPAPSQPAPRVVEPFDLPRSAASLQVERGVGITLASNDYDGDGNATLIERYTFPTFDYVFVTDTGIRTNPTLFLRAQSIAQKDLAEWRTTYSENARVRQEASIGFGTQGSLGRLLTVAVTGSTNNRLQGQMVDDILWDTKLNREIAWTDVFDAGLWNGKVRRDYCAALQAERVRRGTEDNTSCPDFEQLLVDFERDENGQLQLAFTALAYVAGSYAEGPYSVKLPIDATLLAGVKGPYREMLGARDASRTITLRDRLGVIALGPPNYPQAPECATEIFLAPERIGSPQGIEDIRKLVERSPGRVFVQSAGMLGGEWYGAGVIFDGTFTKLKESAKGANASDFDYRAGDLIIEYVSTKEFAEVSYGAWGYGTLLVTHQGKTERIPALFQAWQCT